MPIQRTAVKNLIFIDSSGTQHTTVYCICLLCFNTEYSKFSEQLKWADLDQSYLPNQICMLVLQFIPLDQHHTFIFHSFSPLIKPYIYELIQRSSSSSARFWFLAQLLLPSDVRSNLVFLCRYEISQHFALFTRQLEYRVNITYSIITLRSYSQM